jgi:hypothetical protein
VRSRGSMSISMVKPDAVPPVPPHVEVWRSVRAYGDVKTQRSRRTLQLPELAVAALRAHRVRQAEKRLRAGALWQDSGLVFSTSTGTQQDAAPFAERLRG